MWRGLAALLAKRNPLWLQILKGYSKKEPAKGLISKEALSKLKPGALTSVIEDTPILKNPEGILPDFWRGQTLRKDPSIQSRAGKIASNRFFSEHPLRAGHFPYGGGTPDNPAVIMRLPNISKHNMKYIDKNWKLPGDKTHGPQWVVPDEVMKDRYVSVYPSLMENFHRGKKLSELLKIFNLIRKQKELPWKGYSRGGIASL